MRTFEYGCRNYFIHKKIPADNQVSLIIGGILDNRAADWISADRNRLIALLFDSFMIKFHTNYLVEDWEEDTFRELLSMTQGTNLFWDFAVAVDMCTMPIRSESNQIKHHKTR